MEKLKTESKRGGILRWWPKSKCSSVCPGKGPVIYVESLEVSILFTNSQGITEVPRTLKRLLTITNKDKIQKPQPLQYLLIISSLSQPSSRPQLNDALTASQR